jgi:hypothetical protein
MPRVPDMITAGLILFMIVCPLYGLAVGEPSLRDIGKPCRGHGGVAQYVPRQSAPFQNARAVVVCRDGKIGRI